MRKSITLYIYALCLLIVACSPVEDYRTDVTVCPVHNVDLKEDKVPINYGLVMPDKNRWLNKYYPYSAEFVEGGCIVGKAKQALVRYCPECRKAKKQLKVTLYKGVEPYVNSLEMEFVPIHPRTFKMGSNLDEPNSRDDEKQHQVTLTKGFLIQTTEVTQNHWKIVMGNNPSHFNKCSGWACPVENISWDEVQEFIRKLNELEGSDKYRLPTEAEWEYVCRIGGTTRFTYGNDEKSFGGYAWYINNSENTTHEVGSKIPNAWGLYDIHGNVSEWCSDMYGDYPSDPVRDPKGPEYGTHRVIRGGSWSDQSKFNRCSNRDAVAHGTRTSNIGFRLVRMQ